MRNTARWHCALSAAVLLLLPVSAATENFSEASLKAAVLMNFVKFAEWPQGAVAPGQVFTFCVAGDQSVLEEVALSIKRNSRPDLMSVTAVSLDAQLPVCHMLYVSGIDLQSARHVIDPLQGAPVFPVSDVRGFAAAGGIAELRVENGRMRFTINPTAAHRARIALSAKLLSLATIAKEGPHDIR